MEWMTHLIAPVVLAIIAAVPGILAYANNRRQIRQEADENAVDAWRSMLDPMRQRLEELEGEQVRQRDLIASQQRQIQVLEDDNERLRSGVQLLVNQLVANGHHPVWQPRG